MILPKHSIHAHLAQATLAFLSSAASLIRLSKLFLFSIIIMGQLTHGCREVLGVAVTKP